MTRIRLENVSKTIGGKEILRDINLEISSGDVAVLLGPAGSGKTTLLKIIAGTEKVTRGRIYFDNYDVTNLPPQKRNVSMVFQTFALYPHMTIYENIASPLRVKKIPEIEIKKLVEETAELLKIKHVLSKKPSECSGGEQQRAVIARALVKKPQVYLFDEPLTNLDYKVREMLRVELKRIFTETNATIIYATSNPEEATALGRTLVYIRDGYIAQIGPIKKCLNEPVDIKAFTYFSPLGANVLRSECVIKNNKKLLYVNQFLTIDVSDMPSIDIGKDYLIGIYPHSIKLLSDNGENSEMIKHDKRITIPIEIDIVENRGSELHIIAKCDDIILRILTFKIQTLFSIRNISKAIIPLNEVLLFSADGKYLIRLGGEKVG